MILLPGPIIIHAHRISPFFFSANGNCRNDHLLFIIIQIEHNGEEFTWEDICARNGLGPGTQTTYRFPCARFSPLDLFQETRSIAFDELDRLTWYHGVVKGAAIRPRVLRFGIMQQSCVSSSESSVSGACDKQAGLRTNADFAEANGYPREYANPLGLIGDVGSMELNDPCRICIEESLEATMNQLQNELITPLFGLVAQEFGRYAASLGETEDAATMAGLAASAGKIATTMTRKSVEDFYYYQVLRSTYAGCTFNIYCLLAC